MERLWQGGSGLTHFCGLFWALDVFLVEPLFSLCFMCLCHLGLIHCVCVFGPAYCSRMCCLERLFKNFFVATFLMQVPFSAGSSSLLGIFLFFLHHFAYLSFFRLFISLSFSPSIYIWPSINTLFAFVFILPFPLFLPPSIDFSQLNILKDDNFCFCYIYKIQFYEY